MSISIQDRIASLSSSLNSRRMILSIILISFLLIPSLLLPTDALLNDPLVEMVPSVNSVESSENGNYRTYLRISISYSIISHKKVKMALPSDEVLIDISAPVTNFTAFSRSQNIKLSSEIQVKELQKTDNFFINKNYYIFKIDPSSSQQSFLLFTIDLFLQPITQAGIPDGNYYFTTPQFYSVPLAGLLFATPSRMIYHDIVYNTENDNSILLNSASKNNWIVNTMEVYFITILVMIVITASYFRKKISQWLLTSILTEKSSLYPTQD